MVGRTGNFIKLVKIQFISGYGISELRRNLRNNQGEAIKNFRRLAVIAAVVILLIYSYSRLLVKLLNPLEKAGFEQLLLLLGIALALLFVTFFGFFYLLGTLVFSRDAAFLASLPVRKKSIFASKFAIVYMGELLVSLPLVAVPSIIYGTAVKSGVLFYLKTALLCIFTPALPLAAASLLCFVLMRFAGSVRKRSIFIVIGTLLLMVAFTTGQNILVNYATKRLQTDLARGLIKNQADVISSVGQFFPPLKWAVEALALNGSAGIARLGLYVLLSAAAILIALLLAGRVYGKGALALNEAVRKGARVEYTAGKIQSRTAALILLEWRTLLRVPTYTINSLAFVVIGPIIFSLPLFGFSTNGGKGLKLLFRALVASEGKDYAMLAAAGILVLLGMFNPAAATSVSREGRQFFMSKVLPVSPGEQIRAKFFASYGISLLTVITTGTMMCITFKLEPIYIVTGFALAFCALVPILLVYILIDLSRPKLLWDSPNQAIKQNMNVIISLAAGAVMAGLPGLVAYYLLRQGASLMLVFLLLLIFYLVLSAVIVKTSGNIARGLYKRL